MREGRRKLILDTSAVNALGAETELDAIVRSLGLSYHVGITETVLAEVIAHPEETERRTLLKTLDRLLHPGSCTMPFQWIIEHQAKAFQKDHQGYEWRKLDIRFFAGEQEIFRQEIIHDLSEETRTSNRKWDKDFREIFSAARPAFQRLFENEDRPSLKAVTDHLMCGSGEGGGAYLSIAAGLMERATGVRPAEPEVKDFVERCEPFKALLLGLCFSEYDRCIRGDNVPSLGKAGRYDMFSAVYLPYCKIFVTNDAGQWKALTAVVGLLGREMEVLMYGDFKAKLFGLSVGGTRSR
jgi:hypothetical protein